MRRIVGWVRVPDPTTFKRWLGWTSGRMVSLPDELLLSVVGSAERCCTAGLSLTLDSAVVVRYGHKQAGAEVGCTPKTRRHPSHHPLVALVKETDDGVGMRGRPGHAHTTEGTTQLLGELAGQLQGAGDRDITLRLDKGVVSGDG